MRNKVGRNEISEKLRKSRCGKPLHKLREDRRCAPNTPVALLFTWHFFSNHIAGFIS